jgi:flagella basal body P-ring formation protein FlgA
VDVTIKVNGERKLTLPVFLQASLTVVPAKAEKASDEVVIKAKARVTITARIGDLKVTAGGLAVENGKVGQSIRVENLDSKKVVTGVVTGPGAVEIDLGESK